ncbi:prolyl oligopeptidase family serine peptidase [Pedobacter superstes]|uniref:prolyl oligopeptidase family serine peptidase n=1 Tax=Pedobacter superstes TaxID=3133441 RepID=UPI003D7264CB
MLLQQPLRLLLFHAYDDNVVNARNSLRYFEALVNKNFRSSLHVFSQGGHGIALRIIPVLIGWWRWDLYRP